MELPARRRRLAVGTPKRLNGIGIAMCANLEYRFSYRNLPVPRDSGAGLAKTHFRVNAPE
jgi:hypothetical protein